MRFPRPVQQFLFLILCVFTGCGILLTNTHSGASQTHPNQQLFFPIVTAASKCTVAAPMLTASTEVIATPTAEELLANNTNGRNFYVTVSGRSNGSGSSSDPWDLDSALLESARVTAGDIIWVRGGTYEPVKEPNKYNIKISGSSTNPVTVRAYPGELVTIDAGIEIYTDNVVFWGFNITNTNPDRQASDPGSHPGDLDRGGGIGIFADNITVVNNIIHEGEDGISATSDALNTKIYGNLIYNNGWQGPDRGHGHGIYVQNDTGTKSLKENIIFNDFGAYSFHLYTENGSIKNFSLVGNVVMNDTFLVGGAQPAVNISLLENYVANANIQLGFSSQSNSNLTVQRNWVWNPESTALQVSWWQNVNVTNNCLLSETHPVVNLTYPQSKGTYQWNTNYYQVDTLTRVFLLGSTQLSWSQWRNTTGYDQQSSISTTALAGADIFVRPNAYETKRGNIIIFNWGRANHVVVDVSSLGLKSGDRYTLHNAQNYLNETIQDVYTQNSLTIPMTGWSVATPLGWSEPLQPSTFPSFGVFILTVP